MRAGRKLSCERARRDRNRGDEGRRRSGHSRIIPEEWLKSTPVYARSHRRRNHDRASCVRLPRTVSYLCDESLRRCTVETSFPRTRGSAFVRPGATGLPLAPE
jgi:hypothetical protein